MSAQASVVVSDLATPTARRPAALYWLALGTFAIGTEGFMIAALLTTIAADIRVSVAEAGLLVSIFALAYAASSPLLTALTRRVDRRQLLLGSMSLFAVFNMAAALAHSSWLSRQPACSSRSPPVSTRRTPTRWRARLCLRSSADERLPSLTAG